MIDPSKGQSCGATGQSVSWNGSGITWKGAWSSSTAYIAGDAVRRSGSSYLAGAANVNSPPPDAGKWTLIASRAMPGLDGATVLHGVGSPSNATGRRRDYYLDTAAHVLYGPKFRYCHAKHCSNVWPAQGASLVGPSGPLGTPGPATPSVVLSEPFVSAVTLSHNTDTRIVELSSIPAGEYLVLATVWVGNFNSSPQDGSCELYVNYDDSLS